MQAFGALLWAIAAILILVPFALASIFFRQKSGAPERLYLVLSWATFPLTLPLFLLALMPTDPNLPVVLVILGMLRGMFGLLLIPVGALLLFLAYRERKDNPYIPWLAITTAVNALPILLVTLKQ
jgi:hypothetical protein